MKKYGILVGRFQPFHIGHLQAVRFALGKVKTLWIIIGSAQKSHEPRNPFTAGERLAMIKATLDANKIDPKRWYTIPVYDAEVHSMWTGQIDMLVPEYDVVFTNDAFTKMLFKKRRKQVAAVPMLKRRFLSGTEVRRRIANDGNWKELVPRQVAQIISKVDGVERIKLLLHPK
ncbi:MAG: nicotinamide-nucleotide adenylyltransferase [Nitrososphaerales archaeon]